MKSIGLVLILGVLLIGCSRVEPSMVKFQGSVLDYKTHLPLAGVRVNLVVGNDPNGGAIISGPPQVDIEAVSNAAGFFSFMVPGSSMPVHGLYNVYADSKEFYQIDASGLYVCLGYKSLNVFSAVKMQEINTMDILVDSRSFIEIEFDKVDHSTGDSILYTNCFYIRNTTRQNPDQVFTREVPFDYFGGTIDISYEVLSINGSSFKRWLYDQPLAKGDTTRIRIEY